MSKEITIYNMVFEVTRRCNKTCLHCLRGESENLDITQEIIEKALKDVVSIGTLTFTGGEPTLNVDAIRDTIQYVIRNEVQVGNFFIVLNGTLYNEELVDELYQLYDYVTENYGDNELCTLAVSSNQFQKPRPSVLERYSKLPFYKNYKESNIPTQNILNTGLAAVNNIGNRDVRKCGLDIEVASNCIEVTSGDVYVNALGDVVSCCDLSYDDQQSLALGNVLNTDLSEILLNAKK